MKIAFVSEMVGRLEENEGLLEVFGHMVEHGANITEAVTIMESISLGVIEMEDRLDGGSSRASEKELEDEEWDEGLLCFED